MSELCATSADTGESVRVDFIHMLKMVKDEWKVNNNDISNAAGLSRHIWKLRDLSPPRPSVPFGILHMFFAQLLIIARNNLSFMNYIPRCEMVKRVFRFMPSPQPSLSACYSASFMWSIWDAYGWSPFRVCLSHLMAQVSLRSTAFPTPHGWCGRAPYNRAGGWGYLSAIILLKRGVGRL